MKKGSLITLFILLAGVILWIATSRRDTPPQTPKTEKLPVVTSFYPLTFFASRIGGSHVSVTTLTPPGSEPHEYEPTAKDMQTITASSLLLINGGGLEPWANKLSIDSSKRIVTGESLFVTRTGETAMDPHVWLDPVLAKKQATTILHSLIHIDPTNEKDYTQQASDLFVELDSLDREYAKTLHTCNTRTIVTSHAAFGYLAARYNLTQVPIAGLSPDAEPTIKDLAAITATATHEHVNTIFFENLVSPRLATTIAQEIGATTDVLDPIEGLSESDVQSGSNYVTIMKANLIKLSKALSCQ